MKLHEFLRVGVSQKPAFSTLLIEREWTDEL